MMFLLRSHPQSIADAIAKETSYSKEEIMAKLDDKTFIGKLKKQFPDTITDALSNKKLKHPLEGYLYPAFLYSGGKIPPETRKRLYTSHTAEMLFCF